MADTSIHKFIIKLSENVEEYQVYKNILEPFQLNSPKMYGYISFEENRFLVMDYIPHNQPNWSSTQRCKLAIEWLIRKDKIIEENFEKVSKLKILVGPKWSGSKSWLEEIEKGCSKKVHPLLTKDFYFFIRSKQKYIDQIIKDLNKQGRLTMAHNDLQMNNILFGTDDFTDRIFVIDWSAKIGSVCIDLASIVDHAPKKDQKELVELYKSQINFPEFDEIFKKAMIARHLGTFAWMVMMMLDDQKDNINIDFYEKLTQKIRVELPEIAV